MGGGRECQAGHLCVPAVRLLSDTVTAPAASSSSAGQQEQLGPWWPDSCRSRPPPPPPPRSVSRPRPPGEGAGPAPPPCAPFLEPETRRSGLPPSRVASAPGSLALLSCSGSTPGLPCPLLSSLIVGTMTMDRQILLSHLAPLLPGATPHFLQLPFFSLPH